MKEFDTKITRRTVLQSTAIVGGSMAASSFSTTLPASENLKTDESPMLHEKDVVLFQGDSITDAGRNKRSDRPNDMGALGKGYAMMTAARLLSRNPKLALQCHNRGISGNKVEELHKRWQKDCLDIKPKLLSILIGVNDIWHTFSGNYQGTVDTYETGLKKLLEITREKLPETTIVICEPFALKCGAVDAKWFPDFDRRRAACKRAADEFKCVWVPFQTMFDEAVEKGTAPNYWAGDGVHPSIAGHALMAETWMKTVFPTTA